MLEWFDRMYDRGAAWGAVALTLILVAILATVFGVVAGATLLVWLVTEAGIPAWVVIPPGVLGLAWAAFYAMIKMDGR